MTRSETERGRGATTAQLKADIDDGLAGDKVGGFDPGAAPLGTDEEAGGAVIDPAVVALDRRAQKAAGIDSRSANAADPSLAPTGGRSPSRGSAPLAIAAVLLAVIVACVLLLLAT